MCTADLLAIVLVMGTNGVELGPIEAAEIGRALRRGGKVWHRVIGEDVPEGLLVRFGRASDGRLVVTGLLLAPALDGGEEVTARDLRRVALGAITQDANRYLRGGDEADPLVAAITKHYAHQLVWDVADESTGPPRRPGRRGWDDEHYRRIADLYRQALADEHTRRAPVRFISEREYVSEPTVRRWVSVARSKGFLEPSDRRSRGDQS